MAFRGEELWLFCLRGNAVEPVDIDKEGAKVAVLYVARTIMYWENVANRNHLSRARIQNQDIIVQIVSVVGVL